MVNNMSPNTSKSVSILLLSGMSPDGVIKETGQPESLVRKTAKVLGWNDSWIITDHTSMSDSIVRLAVQGELNLREIGEIHNLSRERVRQILSYSGINIKQLREQRLQEISIKVMDLLKSGNHTAESGSVELGINTSTFHRAKSLISKKNMNTVEESVSDIRKEKHSEYMETAIKMWPDHKVSEIAKVYNISVPYMNQIIIKFRKLYGWFPLKRKKKMEA